MKKPVQISNIKVKMREKNTNAFESKNQIESTIKACLSIVCLCRQVKPTIYRERRGRCCLHCLEHSCELPRNLLAIG